MIAIPLMGSFTANKLDFPALLLDEVPHNGHKRRVGRLNTCTYLNFSVCRNELRLSYQLYSEIGTLLTHNLDSIGK